MNDKILEIDVYKTGIIHVLENGKEIPSIYKLKFFAEVGEMPKIEISQGIKCIAGGNANESAQKRK